MSAYETTHDDMASQRNSYGSARGPARVLSDGYMMTLDATVLIAVIVMFLGPLLTAAFGPIN